MAEGLDYVHGPSPADLKAAGIAFVCRYLSEVNAATQVKLLTAAEAQALTAAGIGIVSNFEWTANRALGGTAAGAQDAQIARDQHTACGGPGTRPIYFSVDFDAQPSQMPAIIDYFRGVASVIGLHRTGAYGGYNVVKGLFDAGVIAWGWQTYAWSAGQWEPRAHIQQYENNVTVAGASVDRDRSMQADFGQWLAQTQGGSATSTTHELIGFPMISQRDSDANANFDCVPASIAACMQWLTGTHYTAGEIKDAVYGPSYVGGTAAKAYIDYCAARGVKLAPVDGNGPALVAALRSSLAAQHPCLITEPDPYAAGWTHVCAAYKCDATSITVMDPWIDAPVTKTDTQWASQLQFNEIWTLERTMQQYSEQSADFKSWFTDTDSSHWKCIKTGHVVQFGIKGFYSSLSLDGNTLPVVGLPTSDEIALTVNGKSVVLQTFERAGIWYDVGHVKDSQPGTGVYALCHLNDPDFIAHVPGLPTQQPTPTPAPVDTTAAVAAITAIADGVAPLIANAIIEVKKL